MEIIVIQCDSNIKQFSLFGQDDFAKKFQRHAAYNLK